MTFTDTRSGDTSGTTVQSGEWSITLPDAEYDVTASPQGQSIGEVVPLASAVTVSADATLAYDIVDYELSGSFSLGGAPAPSIAGSRDWGLVFQSVDGAAKAYGQWDSGADWRLRVPPGTYDVWAFWNDSAPYGTPYSRIATDLVVVADGRTDFAPGAGMLTLAFTVDGEPIAERASALLLGWRDTDAQVYNQDLYASGAVQLLLAAGVYDLWGQVDELESGGLEGLQSFGRCLLIE